jgi:type 1 fimbriae regulatory protein FimB/type 1 fimbriae regulatory protein FimE
MAKPNLKVVAPITEKPTVAPTRRPNKDLRSREHLTQAEVECLMKAVGGNRYGHRDATMILVAYRHGLWASELTDFRWHQVDFKTANLHVRRVQSGTRSTLPLQGDEMRALRRRQKEQEPSSPFVFTSERGSPFTTAGFARARADCGRGQDHDQGPSAHATARLRLQVGERRRRHRSPQAYLGHKNIQHTVRYTELAPTRFKNFWKS